VNEIGSYSHGKTKNKKPFIPERRIMKKVSEQSKDVLRLLVNSGGERVQDGMMREGRALIARGLAKKKGRFLAITAKGRKFIENQ